MPTAELEKVRTALSLAARKAGRGSSTIVNVLETSATHPTFLPTSDFTSGFQGLVNTYGTPRYGEVNPGCFAIVLFPFLFGIMFGDLGHGLLLLLLAGYLIRNEAAMKKQQLDDIMSMVFGGRCADQGWASPFRLPCSLAQPCVTARYVLLLNAICAMYVGLIYNECFSVPLGLFDSVYTLQGVQGTDMEVQWNGGVYPFGVDPAWQRAGNKMTFFNSCATPHPRELRASLLS